MLSEGSHYRKLVMTMSLQLHNIFMMAMLTGCKIPLFCCLIYYHDSWNALLLLSEDHVCQRRCSSNISLEHINDRASSAHNGLSLMTYLMN